MKTLKLLLILMVGFIDLMAQVKYESGYIIKHEGDTISGYILNDVDSKLASQISFKERTESPQPIIFDPSDLYGFGFNNGRTFYKMSIEDSSDTSNKQSFVFAKKVVDGKIDLWHLRKRKGKSRFFLRNNETNNSVNLIEPQKLTITGQDGKKYKKKDNTYLGLLGYVIDDSEIMRINQKNLRYSEKKITNAIVDYDNSFDNKYPVKIYSEKVVRSFEFLGGTTLVTNPDWQIYRAGVFYTRNFVEKSAKTSVAMGVTYMSQINTNETIAEPEKGTIHYKTNIINLIPLGTYLKFKYRLFQPYLFVGVGLPIFIHSFKTYKDFEVVDQYNKFATFPLPVFRMGTRINFGKRAIMIELVPISFSPLFSVGLSI